MAAQFYVFVLFMLFNSSTVQATETDNYFDRNKGIADSSEIINRIVNGYFDEIVETYQEYRRSPNRLGIGLQSMKCNVSKLLDIASYRINTLYPSVYEDIVNSEAEQKGSIEIEDSVYRDSGIRSDIKFTFQSFLSCHSRVDKNDKKQQKLLHCANRYFHPQVKRFAQSRYLNLLKRPKRFENLRNCDNNQVFLYFKKRWPVTLCFDYTEAGKKFPGFIHFKRHKGNLRIANIKLRY